MVTLFYLYNFIKQPVRSQCKYLDKPLEDLGLL